MPVVEPTKGKGGSRDEIAAVGEISSQAWKDLAAAFTRAADQEPSNQPLSAADRQLIISDCNATPPRSAANEETSK